MIRTPLDDEQDQRVAVFGLPKALQDIPRFSNSDNAEVADSEFNPGPAKQTYPVPDTGGGAPVDFAGPVLPNDSGVIPRLDTEGSAPDPTTIDSKMTYAGDQKPLIAAPSDASRMQGVTLPSSSPQMERDLARSAELSKGSGLDQFSQNHHILGPILRGLDIAGSFLAPNLAVNIPGTTLHHQLLENENRNNLTTDIAQQERQVQTGHQQAEAEHTQAETAALPAQTKEREAQTNRLNAETEALGRPQSSFQKMEDGSIVQLTTDKDSGQTTAKTIYKGDPKIETDMATLMVGGKPHSVLVNKKTGATIKDLGETKTPNASEGTWTMQEDDKGNPVLFNSKTTQTKAAPQSLSKPGSYEKQHGPAEDAQRYADMYMNSGEFTAAGDEALMEKYFELAKPSSGFRMSEPQMKMLNQGRSWMEGIKAKATHLFSPGAPYFSDEQRKQIYATMNMVAASKNGGQGGHVPGGTASGLTEGQTGTGSDNKKYVVKGGVWVAQ